MKILNRPSYGISAVVFFLLAAFVNAGIEENLSPEQAQTVEDIPSGEIQVVEENLSPEEAYVADDDFLSGEIQLVEEDSLLEPAQIPEELSLDQARALALTRSLSLKSQMEAYWASSDSVKASKWAYEPEFEVTARQQITDRDNNNSQQTSTGRTFLAQEESLYNTSLKNLLPSGGTVSLDFRITDRINNLGGTTFAPEVEREYETFAGITFQQPLLKNGGRNNETRVQIRLAKGQSEIAFQEVRGQLATLISRVEIAYWNLYQATEKMKLREESLKIARDILVDNRERLRLGKMAKLDILEAEAGVAERERELVESKAELNDVRNDLNIYFSQTLVEADVEFVPTETLQIAPMTESWEEIAAESLFNHPEYLRLKEEAKSAGIRLAYAKNQRLPQLDLTLTYGFNGLGQSIDDSWDRLNDYDKADWFAGIQLNVPIFGDRQAYYEMSAAKRRKQKAILDLKEIEMQILNLSKKAYRNMHFNYNMYQKLNQVAGFRGKLLEAELAKLGEGKSNSREVFEVESDLSEAKIKELEEMVQYFAKQIELRVIQGTFLKERDIDIIKDQIPN